MGVVGEWRNRRGRWMVDGWTDKGRNIQDKGWERGGTREEQGRKREETGRKRGGKGEEQVI